MYNQPETFPYFIPIIWQGNGTHVSPNYSSRGSLYGVSGIPHGQWGGTIPVVGGGTGVYSSYVNAHNQIVNLNSPVEIELSLGVSEDQLILEAETTMTGSITTTNNKIQFILTYDLVDEMGADYFASVKSYYQEDFPLTTTGETAEFSHAFPIDPSWDLYKVKGIVIIQNIVNGNAPIHQAAMASFEGLTPMFSSNVNQGPPSLFVQFYDNSLPAQNIVSWEWDLNGDGTIDSTDENPSYTYTEIGSYDVTLTISDGTDTVEVTMENYITVTEPDDISGNVSGTWHIDHSPYNISGDIVIPEDSFLIIEPGVEIITSNSEIIIEGYIYANAEDDEPIVFTSDTTWKGLRIINSQIENTLYNCKFDNASQTALIINDSVVNLIGNTFYENSASTNPGALKITNSNDTILKNNIFANNLSTNGAAAVEINASSFSVENNLFVNNTGYIGSSFAVRSGSAITFDNNTVANNEFTSSNGYHIFNHNSYLQIRNSIIIGESRLISNFSGAATIAEYSNISNGYSGGGNIDEDPLFDNPSEGIGIDYNGLDAVWYLSDESPCVDAGNPEETYNDPEDPYNPGYAKFPAKGTIRNDMGTYGGSGTSFWVSVEEETIIPHPVTENRIITYPNPFNPSVNISLDSIEYSSESPVTLKIYNTKGQVVKTLLHNVVTEKTNFIWNGHDERNRPLPSGIYFIGFVSGNVNVNQKVLLLK